MHGDGCHLKRAILSRARLASSAFTLACMRQCMRQCKYRRVSAAQAHARQQHRTRLTLIPLGPVDTYVSWPGYQPSIGVCASDLASLLTSRPPRHTRVRAAASTWPQTMHVRPGSCNKARQKPNTGRIPLSPPRIANARGVSMQPKKQLRSHPRHCLAVALHDLARITDKHKRIVRSFGRVLLVPLPGQREDAPDLVALAGLNTLEKSERTPPRRPAKRKLVRRRQTHGLEIEPCNMTPTPCACTGAHRHEGASVSETTSCCYPPRLRPIFPALTPICHERLQCQIHRQQPAAATHLGKDVGLGACTVAASVTRDRLLRHRVPLRAAHGATQAAITNADAPGMQTAVSRHSSSSYMMPCVLYSAPQATTTSASVAAANAGEKAHLRRQPRPYDCQTNASPPLL